MKTRIISAAVGIVLLLAVLICPYTAVFAAAMAALAAIAVWELLHNTGYVKRNTLTVIAMVFALAEVLLIYFSRSSPFASVATVVLPLLFWVAVILFLLKNHATTDAVTGGWAAFATVYVTVGFASLAHMRGTADGMLSIFLVLVIPWMSDTGAYFVGTFFGKHKMTPVISPKKSWEGFFGGWVVSVGSAVLTGVIYQTVTGMGVSLIRLALYALVLAPLSVCGDLFASIVKRQCGIKDYGNLMPGHGGVMDRFDSVLIIAPLLLCLRIFVG